MVSQARGSVRLKLKNHRLKPAVSVGCSRGVKLKLKYHTAFKGSVSESARRVVRSKLKYHTASSRWYLKSGLRVVRFEAEALAGSG